MIFVNLFFCLVNGWLFFFFLGEGKGWLTSINALAFILNLFPVVMALL